MGEPGCWGDSLVAWDGAAGVSLARHPPPPPPTSPQAFCDSVMTLCLFWTPLLLPAPPTPAR